MTLGEVWTALRNAWWLPLLGVITAAAAGLGISLLQTPVYSSSTQLFVSTPIATSATDVLQGSQFSQQRVTSYAELLRGEELAGRVVNRLALAKSPKQLSNEIAVFVPTDSVLLDVTVTDPSPQRAQRIAEAVGTEFTAMAAQLETPGTGGITPVKVTVTQKPDLPRSPSSPDFLRRLGFGALVGLVLGAGAAIARARLDRSVKGDAVADAVGAPVVGIIVQDDALAREHTIDLVQGGRTAEGYRQLRANLEFLNGEDPPKVVLVSSALPDEGRTTLVINLGLALAETGRRSAIIEADLRQPTLTRYLGMVPGAGLTDVLLDRAALDEVAQTYQENLRVIPCGPNPSNRAQLLASGRMRAVVEKLRADNDVVLIQGPPLLPVADSSSLAVHCDAALLSVRYGRTRKDQLRQAVGTLMRVGVTSIGVVLNLVPPKAELACAYDNVRSCHPDDAKHRAH
jgi:capsular exopolysaccharide synthesis family protein